MWDTADVRKHETATSGAARARPRPLSLSPLTPLSLSSYPFSPELASQRAPDERDGHLHPGVVVGAGEGQRPPPGLPRLLPQQQLHLRPDHQGQQVGHGRDAHQTE